jgi:hypothetical protein
MSAAPSRHACRLHNRGFSDWIVQLLCPVEKLSQSSEISGSHGDVYTSISSGTLALLSWRNWQTCHRRLLPPVSAPHTRQSFLLDNTAQHPRWQISSSSVRFNVLEVSNIMMTVFWDIQPCSFVEVDRTDVGTVRNSEISVYFYENTRLYIPEGCHSLPWEPEISLRKTKGRLHYDSSSWWWSQ